MEDVTAQLSEKPAISPVETGWAEARRRGGRGLRTCLPAVLERTSHRRESAPAEDNIVRGED
ncbi:hypothetical protein ACGFT2_03185 [Streptomyces sp. NPDC048514]|uniref:hypothetical protein n=1 Tax=Streptomyces sp. NPDC048514 TaxID=3365564 RepID=UPI00371294AD